MCIRDRNASQQVQLEQLVFHAKENELRQQRLMRFFISLSALTEAKVLCENMPKQLAETFDLAHVDIKFIAERVSKVEGMAMLFSGNEGYAWLAERLADGHSVCDNRMPSGPRDLLLGSTAASIRSLAVVPVTNRSATLVAMIVLGATQADRYQPGVDTVFLDLVGAMVSATCWRLGIV